MKKKIKNNKGMTLTELLVGLALFSIITAAVCTIFIPILNVYDRANELAECNTLLDNVANQIIGDLSESTGAPVLGVNTAQITIVNPGDVVYTVADGVLCRNGNPVFAKAYYRNKSVSFSLSGSGNPYTLTVAVRLDKYGYETSRDYAVRPLTLNQYTPSA